MVQALTDDPQGCTINQSVAVFDLDFRLLVLPFEISWIFFFFHILGLSFIVPVQIKVPGLKKNNNKIGPKNYKMWKSENM